MEREKIRDMLLGIAVGDAFGAGIEFQDRDWIKDNVDFTKFVNEREGERAEGYEPGLYSDDTEHSIGLMEALMSRRPFSEGLLLEMWKREYDNDRKAKGFPRQGHGTIKDWYEGRKTIDEVKAEQAAREDPGCGPAMRAVPLGLVDHGLISRYAAINADASNGTEKARAASVLVARASEYLMVKGGMPEGVFGYCKEFISDKETLEYLGRLERLPKSCGLNESDFEILCGPQPIPYFKEAYGVEIRGMPDSAMRVAGAALHITSYAKDAFAGLRDAVSLGGDVDSVAAVCAGILGGRYGLGSLPRFMVDGVEGKDRIADMSSRFSEYLNDADPAVEA